MKELMTCKVIKYLNSAVKVKLSNGMKAILTSQEISDISIPIDEKVYIGQILTVLVSYTNKELKLEHKKLLKSYTEFFEEHLGDMVRARVVFTCNSGCMVELSSNVHCFVKGMCNLQKGTWLWASITMYGKVMIDSITYDEERSYYPDYKYYNTNLYQEEQQAA